jgi:hypothetical protein
MTWAFSSYLLMKGFKNLFKQYDIFIDLKMALIIGFLLALVVTVSTMIHLK